MGTDITSDGPGKIIFYQKHEGPYFMLVCIHQEDDQARDSQQVEDAPPTRDVGHRSGKGVIDTVSSWKERLQRCLHTDTFNCFIDVNISSKHNILLSVND